MASDRELLTIRGVKFYARRDAKGRFTELDRVDRSLSQDVRRHAKRTVPAGQGDRGDQKPRNKK
jgi:hypothetical protein